MHSIRQRVAAWWRGFSFPEGHPIWNEIVRLVKYQVVGFSNSLVSFGVLNLFYFLWPPTWVAPLVLGSSAAYAAGDLNSFWWNGRWTFRSGESRWRQGARFATLSLAFMGLNAALLWGSSGWLLALLLPAWLMHSLPQLFSMIIGSLGYLFCRIWVFREQQTPSGA